MQNEAQEEPITKIEESTDKQLEMIILVGIPASGKSTFSKSIFPSYAHVSKDLLKKRKGLTKDEQQTRLIENAFSRKQSVVVDNNNESKEIRKSLIELALRYNAKVIGYFFESNIRDCKERNAKRTGKARVPDKAIYIKASQLEIPSMDEGFQELYYVTMKKEKGFNVTPWKDVDMKALIERNPKKRIKKSSN